MRRSRRMAPNTHIITSDIVIFCGKTVVAVSSAASRLAFWGMRCVSETLEILVFRMFSSSWFREIT